MPIFINSSEVEAHPQANLLGFDLMNAYFDKNLTDLEVSMLEKGIDVLFLSGVLTVEMLNALDEKGKGRLLLCTVLSSVPPESMNRLFTFPEGYIPPSIKMLTLSALLSGEDALIDKYLSEISIDDLSSLVMAHNCTLLKELSQRGRLEEIEKILHYPIHDTSKIKDLLEPADFQKFIVSAQRYGDTQAKLIEIFIEKEPTILIEVFFRDCRNFFRDCRNLTVLTLPQGLTHIGSYAFEGCIGLTALTLPQGLTHIGSSAFSGCTRLTALTLPQGLTHIGSSAFSGCTRLTVLTLPQGLTHIGSYAFEGCRGLTALTLPQGLTHIGNGAFEGCTGLTALTLPQGLTHIGDDAFSGCTRLTALTLPQGLKDIGDYAFWGCTRLTHIIINTNSYVELVRIKALLPEEHCNKVIKNPVYDSVISIQKECYASDYILLQSSPIYSQKAARINKLSNNLFGEIDKFDEGSYLIFKNKIKGLEVPTTEEGLEAYKETLKVFLSTLNAKEKEKSPIPENYAICITKLQQYSDNVYSKKIKKEKLHPGFFSENKEVSLAVERKSAIIDKAIVYLEGDLEQSFNQDELILINTRGIASKYY